MRPIASVVVSPADAVPQGVRVIDESSNIVRKDGMRIQSKFFNSVATPPGPGRAYAEP